VVEWINQSISETDDKLLVFATHHKMIEALVRRSLTKSVVIDGSVSSRRRQVVIEQFQTDNRVRLLVANTKSAGTGTDGLQQVCNTVVFAELPWTPGTVVQGEDRLWRIGVTGDVRCVYLVAHKTVEERLCELLQEKQGIVSATLDGGTIDGDLDVFDQLIKEIGR